MNNTMSEGVSERSSGGAVNLVSGTARLNFACLAIRTGAFPCLTNATLFPLACKIVGEHAVTGRITSEAVVIKVSTDGSVLGLEAEAEVVLRCGKVVSEHAVTGSITGEPVILEPSANGTPFGVNTNAEAVVLRCSKLVSEHAVTGSVTGEPVILEPSANGTPFSVNTDGEVILSISEVSFDGSILGLDAKAEVVLGCDKLVGKHAVTGRVASKCVIAKLSANGAPFGVNTDGEVVFSSEVHHLLCKFLEI